jgi:hypothetical protein
MNKKVQGIYLLAQGILLVEFSNNTFFIIFDFKILYYGEVKMLNLSYSEITEAVQSLKYEDKIELKELLNHYLIEERREEIYNNFQKSKKEVASGKVKYYKSSKELRKALEND